jgi:hypothetical protein
MKYLYKYPQAAFPYAELIETNRGRGKRDFEYELLDTGVFDQDRYFDVFVEYAKESPQDVLIRITVHNRGPEPAEVHVLPTLWFRNLWSWSVGVDRPILRRAGGAEGYEAIAAADPALGELHLYCEGDVPLLFTENETNTQRIFGAPNRIPYVRGVPNGCYWGRSWGGRAGCGQFRDQANTAREPRGAVKAGISLQVVLRGGSLSRWCRIRSPR